MTNYQTDASVQQLAIQVHWCLLDHATRWFSSHVKQLMGFSLFCGCS